MNIKLENGHEADVSHVVRQDGSVLLLAISDAHKHEHVLTLGSVEEPLPDHYSAEHLQKDLTAARSYAASMAVSKKRRAELLRDLET